MFHAILCSSIAVLSLGADVSADEAASKDLKKEMADLNRQLTDAKKLVQDLTNEKKVLETTLTDEKTRVQKRIIAMQEAAASAREAQKVSEDKIQVEERKSREYALAIQEVTKELNGVQVEIDRLRKDIEVAVEETKRAQKKLVDKADEVEARKALFDRLAKAVREKRYDDALKLVEEVDKANETPKTK